MVCRLRYPKSDAPRHHVPCLVDSLSLSIHIYIFYNIIKSIINLFYIYVMFSIFKLVCPITLNPIQSLLFLDGQTQGPFPPTSPSASRAARSPAPRLPPWRASRTPAVPEALMLRESANRCP